MTGALPSAYKFLSHFVELYDSNETFCESLIVSLEKTAVCNLISIHSKSKIEENPTEVIHVIGTYNMTCVSIVLSNLVGPSHQYVKTLNFKERVTCIIQSDFDHVVGRIVQAIKALRNPGPDGVVTFSIAMDAKKYQLALKALLCTRPLSVALIPTNL